jgi:hypothetical protein
MVFSVFLCCALALLLWARERERPEFVALNRLCLGSTSVKAEDDHVKNPSD